MAEDRENEKRRRAEFDANHQRVIATEQQRRDNFDADMQRRQQQEAQFR